MEHPMQTLTTMKSLTVTGPGVAEFLEAERPPVGPRDVAVKIKACGICGSDVFYVQRGGIPPRDSHTPLGHEPAGEIIEVGAEVTGAAVGDHVVINPMANRDGIIGNGGAQGALSDEVVLFDAEAGVHFRVIPDEVPWAVAALNEPMAVAYHGVNRSGADLRSHRRRQEERNQLHVARYAITDWYSSRSRFSRSGTMSPSMISLKCGVLRCASSAA